MTRHQRGTCGRYCVLFGLIGATAALALFVHALVRDIHAGTTF